MKFASDRDFVDSPGLASKLRASRVVDVERHARAAEALDESTAERGRRGEHAEARGDLRAILRQGDRAFDRTLIAISSDVKNASTADFALSARYAP